jgi:hypothetical protein
MNYPNEPDLDIPSEADISVSTLVRFSVPMFI